MTTLRHTAPFLTGLAAALFFGIAMAQVAVAEDPLSSITLSPVDKHFNVKPGETVNDTFVILNDGRTAYDFLTYTSPYSVDDRTYNPNYDDINAPRADAYKWVGFSQSRWHLEPRERVVVPFTLRVPEYASPGSHYGVLFAETQPDEKDKTNIVRKRRVGLIVHVTVAEGNRVEGRVSEIKIDQYQPFTPLTSTISVQNTGDSDFLAKSSISISDIFGSVKYQNNDERYILPDTTRDTSLSWEGSPWFGLYNVTVSTSVLGVETKKEHLVLVAPYWLFLLVGLGVLLGAADALRRHKRTSSSRHRR